MTSSMAAASILVVNDEIQVLSFIMELLRMQGYGVEGTWDPDEALRLARPSGAPPSVADRPRHAGH